jgi:hypothetical protein
MKEAVYPRSEMWKKMESMVEMIKLGEFGILKRRNYGGA